MIKEDKILDIIDNINSINYCLDGNSVVTISISSEDIIKSIDSIKEELISDIKLINEDDTLKVCRDERIKGILKGKVSSRLKLLYSIDFLKNRVRAQGEKIELSQNVINYLNNEL